MTYTGTFSRDVEAELEEIALSALAAESDRGGFKRRHSKNAPRKVIIRAIRRANIGRRQHEKLPTQPKRIKRWLRRYEDATRPARKRRGE